MHGGLWAAWSAQDSPDDFPAVWDGARSVPLEQPPELSQLTCTVVEWANGVQVRACTVVRQCKMAPVRYIT